MAHCIMKQHRRQQLHFWRKKNDRFKDSIVNHLNVFDTDENRISNELLSKSMPEVAVAVATVHFSSSNCFGKEFGPPRLMNAFLTIFWKANGLWEGRHTSIFDLKPHRQFSIRTYQFCKLHCARAAQWILPCSTPSFIPYEMRDSHPLFVQPTESPFSHPGWLWRLLSNQAS